MLGLQPITMVTIGAAFVFGMVLALLGSLKLALAKRLDLNEGRVSTLFAALNLALMPMMILSGVVVDLGGVTPVLIFGSLLTALALFTLAVRPGYGQALFALLLAGLGSAGVSTASIVLMPRAFFGPNQVTASLNLGNVFFALGALITPPLTGILLYKFEWRRTLGLLAFVCLAPALLAAAASSQLGELRPEGMESTTGSLSELLAQPTVWLAGLVFAFYAPLEGAISVWATTFSTETGVPERRAPWLLAGFWATFLAARLLAAYAQHGGLTSSLWEPWIVVVPPLLAAAVLGNLAGAIRPGQAWFGMLVLGFLLGPFFPTLLGMLFRRLHETDLSADGTAYGCVFALGSLGSLLCAPLMGSIARRRQVQAALRIPMLMALLLTAAALVFCLAV
jgi:fucose permease